MSERTGRLQSIDALRGLAAIAVMLYHALGLGIFGQYNVTVDSLSILINQILLLPVSFGFAGVYLFFVISGFCIHQRWAKGQIKGILEPVKFIPFWKRRFRRIYPAYIVALAFYLGISYFSDTLVFDSFFAWNLISHIFMLHNFSVNTVHAIDPVFWTLAIEEQLYLLYFLLLWMRCRFGWKKTLLICLTARFAWFGLALIIFKLFGLKIPVSESAISNWVIWAMGAVAIENAVGLIKLPKYCYSLWIMFATLITAAVIYWIDWILQVGGLFHTFTIVFGQVIWGVAFFILINVVVSLELNNMFSKRVAGEYFRKFIKIFAFVGGFSYSLYLMHNFVFYFMGNSHWLIKTMAGLVFAYFFYLIVEKPFIKPSIIRTNGLSS